MADRSQVQLSHSSRDRNRGYTEITRSASPTPQLSSGQANTPTTSKSLTSGGRGRLIWIEDIERALLEALISELHEGRRADSGYKKQSWEAAREAVKAADNLKQPIQISHCKFKHGNFKRDWKVWMEFTDQSGFSVDENGVVTGNSQAIAAYLEAHPEACRFAKAPMKFCDLAQVLFEGVLATGSAVISIETFISQSIEQEDTATSPSTTSPSATSPSVASPPAMSPAMLPLKRARAESVSATRKRTALDRMSDRFGKLSYQLSRQTDCQLMMYEASKSDIQQDAIKSFHKHFSISMAVFPDLTQSYLALPKREAFPPSPVGLACQDWSGVHCNFSM